MRNCLFCHVRSKWAREYRQKARDVHFSQINVHNRGECECSVCAGYCFHTYLYIAIAHVTLTLTTAKKRHINYQIHVGTPYTDSHYYNIMLPTLTHEYIIMRDTHMYDCVYVGGAEFIAGVYKERLYASCHPEYVRFHYTHVAAASHAI